MELRTFFAALADPRLPRTRRYPLSDIVVIVFCGLLSGADNYVEIATWANTRKQWFQDKLHISPIPSHDTLTRVMAKLLPEQLNHCLMQLAHLLSASLPEPKQIPVIALDGKELKGALGKLNLVSAWASHAQLTLAVQAVPSETNEIPVVQELLRLVDIKDSVVTADAMHCQKETAKIIVEKEADYVLTLKKNQGTLWQTAEDYFTRLVSEMDIAVKEAKSMEKAHGQWIEVRRCRLVGDVGWFDPNDHWAGLKGVAQVVYERRRGKEVRQMCRYVLTSLTSAAQVLGCLRGHWGIENSQHWRLDVFYREDDSRVRSGNGAQNLAMLRRMSLSVLKRDTFERAGVQTRRKKAGWDDEYRERLLAISHIL